MLLATADIAVAHDDDSLEAWVDDWVDEVLDVGVTVDAFGEFMAMARRHPRFFGRPVPTRRTAPSNTRGVGPPSGGAAPAGVEQWRSLVAAYFPADQVERALRVMECESGGLASAKSRSSSASGLFQHLGKYWVARSAAAGWAGASIWDPTANVAVAAWLARTGGWGHWSCRG